jgi:ribosomal protein S18 acetylase RimI-like enzyme
MTAEPITVRLCTAEDLPALHAKEPHPAARIAQRHFDRQSAGNYFYAVALRGTEPLGTSVLDCDPKNRLRPELKNLWVYPESRRQGAARELTTFLEEQAAGLGFVEVFLRVDPENEAAIPMYIGLDYSPTGDHALTTYESVDATGTLGTYEQMDAVYRKSLLVR